MDANVAQPAALIGDPTRAAILMALNDGRAQPASALAYAAGVTPQAASNHLAKLVEGGLLTVDSEGRHRYYRLAGPHVAQALEALILLAPRVRALDEPRSPKARALRQARSCYDHLAGRLGVALTEALEARGFLSPSDVDPKAFVLTPEGLAALEELGVGIPRARRGVRLARRCLDWTERRHHLAGPLGAALLARLLELGWLAHEPEGRALRITLEGRNGLARLGVSLAEPAVA